MSDVVLTTNFSDLTLFRRGKVRDVYEVEDKLLIVASDRISCFDVVLSCGVPAKGRVLTGLSCFWFDYCADIVENHLVSCRVEEYPRGLQKYADLLKGRSMLVRKTKPLAVECVVRGYLSGSGWKEYQKTRAVCGIPLPAGLKESDKLPEVIFTPSTKADVGHDANITHQAAQELIGKKAAEQVRELSIALYKKASAYAEKKGIIIADTKFEFGVYDGKVILIDEALTPDSSRFWPKDQYVPGRPQPSFDKQFVRDYLETLSWDKTPPAPALPRDIIEKTTEKYLEAYRRLTGSQLERFANDTF